MAATLAPRAGGEQFVLEGVSWQLYEMLLRETAERHIFITYGSYVSADTSAAFPGLRAADVQRFLDEAQDKVQGPTVLAFRDWVRSGGATQ